MAGVTTPDRFGRYRVVRRIGSGGFATVWLAARRGARRAGRGQGAGRQLGAPAGRADRFQEEARILRRADSDRVVRVHDIGELPTGGRTS